MQRGTYVRTDEIKEKNRKSLVGRKRPLYVIEKISKSNKGKKENEKNPMWKGNDVGYFALHAWIKRKIVKLEFCECCGKNKSKDLANKGIYNRDFKNWEWLCRSCHMTKDGRINNLKQYN